MSTSEIESLRQYHKRRCDQERRLTDMAQPGIAADRHRELLRLHELLYRDLDLVCSATSQAETANRPEQL